jgi:MYXO-CTERM domain-containing protein
MHVARHSSDGSQIYAGSSLGGVWIGELDGTDWYPIGDNLFGGAHELAVLPPDEQGGPDVVLAATDGGRVHRSADDGQTWVVPEGMGEPTGCRRVLTTSDGGHTVFMVLRYGDFSALLRSTDRAATFEQVYDLGDYRGAVWAPRDGGSEVYLLAGGPTVHRSDDNGDSWTEVGSIAVGGNTGELVGSEAGAPRLWAVVRVDNQRDLYRSDDAGASWSFVTDVNDYWRSLNASIEDVDVFAWGGVEVYRTDDGGQSFAITNSWVDYYDEPEIRLHADVPGIDVTLDVDGEEIWYVSTDGGLYLSRDRLATVENLSLNGLRVSQYYSTLTSRDDPSHVAAGSQDQGFQITTFLEQDDELFEFDQLVSGDYGHVTSHDGSHDWVYTTYPGILLAYWGTYDNPVIFNIEFPPDERHAWLPPIEADPLVKEAFFFPATRLYRYLRQDAAWEPEIWSELVVNTDDEDEYISAIEFSPVDPERAYLATNRGRMFYSDDRAVTWAESDSAGPNPHYFYGTALVASSLDVDTVYAGGSGYDGPAVSRSTDGGETFEPFDEGLPDTLVYCLAEAGDGSGALYAGTETSAYRRDADWDEWVDITGNSAPVTIYWSVEAVPAEGAMRFGTYGRGIWDYRFDPEVWGSVDGGPDEGADAGAPGSGQSFTALGGGCRCSAGLGGGGSSFGSLLVLGLLAIGLLRRR